MYISYFHLYRIGITILMANLLFHSIKTNLISFKILFRYRLYFNYRCLYICIEPSAPVNVTVIQMTCSSVNIAWSPPANTGGLPIDGYIVFYEEDGRQVNITTNMLFVIISELKSLPTTFKLVTMNAIGYTNENESETVKLKGITNYYYYYLLIGIHYVYCVLYVYVYNTDDVC